MKGNRLAALLIGLSCLLLTACSLNTNGHTNNHPDANAPIAGESYLLKPEIENINEHLDYENKPLHKIYFAGGCFWGVEAFMSRIYGVAEVTSGYANGTGEKPSYEDVIKGHQHFAETVEVAYDPERVSLKTLIDRLFTVIDPTSEDKQGNDVGVQYRSGIYYTDKEDEPIVKAAVKQEQQYYEDKIVTETVALKNFYPAEEFHQDYLEKNPNGYCHISLATANEFPITPIAEDKEIVKNLSE